MEGARCHRIAGVWCATVGRFRGTGRRGGAEAQQGLLAALLPPTDPTPRPARNCGLAGRGAAHLLDAATLIAEEWEKVTQTSVLHCWLKSNIPPVAMSASLTASRGEYRQGFGSVESDLDEVLALMRGTSLEREVIGGASERDAREGLRAWLGAEDDEDAIVDTADMIALSSDDSSDANE